MPTAFRTFFRELNPDFVHVKIVTDCRLFINAMLAAGAVFNGIIQFRILLYVANAAMMDNMVVALMVNVMK